MTQACLLAGMSRRGSWALLVGTSTMDPQALPSLHSQAAMGLSHERVAHPPTSQAHQAEEWRAFSDFV